MPILDAVERGALFRLTRFVTLSIILAFCIPLGIAGCVYYYFFGVDSHIAYADLNNQTRIVSDLSQQSAPSQSSPSETSPSVTAGPVIPDTLKPYFDTPEEEQGLIERLNSLDASERYDYVNNLSAVVVDARNDGANVPQVIDQYYAAKDRRIGRTQMDKAILWGSRIGLVIFTAFIMILVAIASLILVLLAIERNTRPAKAVRAI